MQNLQETNIKDNQLAEMTNYEFCSVYIFLGFNNCMDRSCQTVLTKINLLIKGILLFYRSYISIIEIATVK